MDRFVRLSDDEQRHYFEQAAERMGLGPQIIEKGFWVCWTLRKLFALPDIGSMFIFKGISRDSHGQTDNKKPAISSGFCTSLDGVG
jgi:hypothetical protein